MAEQSLYRRHRPQSFAEVVGQEHVTRTLGNAIERDRVHHAYLFVGSRGTGKTSMAKILARSLNCVDGPTLEPCGECDPCRAIAAGSSLDVVEMDAASNRSVDDIRELRERVGYAPAEGSWKVYILDEAHMLTREAWNAFLKTLEEPPPNTVFVLATTEAHKVMPTIVDRCQRFDFARPSLEHLVAVLRRAADAEGIQIPDEALAPIAGAANGSFRDALGTLDQLVSYSGTEIDTADVLDVLGVADADLLYRATDAIGAGDGRAALGVIAELAESGRDPARFGTDLIAHLRSLLIVETVGEVPDHLFVAGEHAARLSTQARATEGASLVRAIDLLSEAIAGIREGDEARTAIELALLRAARPEIDPSRAAIVQRLERLERSGPPSGEPPAPEASPPPAEATSAPVGPQTVASDPGPQSAAPSEPVPESAPSPAPEPGTPSPATATATSSPASAEPPSAGVPPAAQDAPADSPGEGARADLDQLRSAWPAVLAALTDSAGAFLAAAFDGTAPAARRPDGTLEVSFPASSTFQMRKAAGKEERESLISAVAAVTGARPRIEFVIAGEGAAPEPERSGGDRVAGEDLVEMFKDQFDAEELIDDPKEDAS